MIIAKPNITNLSTTTRTTIESSGLFGSKAFINCVPSFAKLQGEDGGTSGTVMSREDVIRGLQEKYRQAGLRSLNELERRHWAATQAIMLGRGGITIVSLALRMSPNTIKRGIQELTAGQSGSTSQHDSRIRRSGGGRKSKTPESNEVTRERNRHAPRRGS